jgi:hypothetical protein
VAGLLQRNDTEACAKNRALAARKLALIEKKISELVTMRDALASQARRSVRQKIKARRMPNH